MTHTQLPRAYRLAVVAASTSALALTCFVAPAQASGRPLTTTLLGANEIPGPGDPDGSGTATVRVNAGRGEICYSLAVTDIAPATAAHIHVGDAITAGPVVVALQAPTTGTSSGCTAVSRELARAIRSDPELYYVNVHNADYPAGALRGQLA